MEEMQMKIQISCVQMEPTLLEVTANLKKIEEYIEKVMEEKKNTNLIIFPELITSGYECGSEFQDISEVAGSGESMKRIGKLAKAYKVNIIYGFPQRHSNISDVLYNSAGFIDENGELKGIYNKVHLFDSEKKYFREGCNYPIIETSFGKLGIMICWDTAFPEVARSYGLQGADLIAIATNWENPYSEDWDLIIKARAFDNCTYVAGANRIGRDKELSFFGHSKIVDPLGKPIIELNKEEEGVISAELDLELPKKLRQEYYTFFRDRRPDTYELLTNKY